MVGTALPFCDNRFSRRLLHPDTQRRRIVLFAVRQTTQMRNKSSGDVGAELLGSPCYYYPCDSLTALYMEASS